MSFEYELRLPSGTLDARSRADLERGVKKLGAVMGPDGSSTLLQGSGSRVENATIFYRSNGVFLVVESLSTLRSPAVQSLFGLARTLGLSLYEADDDLPLDWGDVPPLQNP